LVFGFSFCFTCTFVPSFASKWVSEYLSSSHQAHFSLPLFFESQGEEEKGRGQRRTQLLLEYFFCYVFILLSITHPPNNLLLRFNVQHLLSSSNSTFPFLFGKKMCSIYTMQCNAMRCDAAYKQTQQPPRATRDI
jgi:hypothetical protein